MTKSIVLGADDYGQAEAVSRGIIDLILAGRLTATSSLVNGSDWPIHARWLAPCRAHADLGLHLNLTQGAPLSAAFRAAHGKTFPSLGRLLMLAVLGRLSVAVVAEELRAQLEAFKDTLGFFPAYLDGHQHVHHFPVVRDALRLVYEAAGLKPLGVRVRSVYRPIGWRDALSSPKASLIQWTGAAALRNEWLEPEAIPHNTSFEGIYSFTESPRCRRHFQAFLQNIQPGGVIMCHPGRESHDPTDPIAPTRYLEYTYLMSDAFLQDCERAGIQLTRFTALA